MNRSRTKPSGRLTHGLSSRARTEDWFDDAKQLAYELVGDASKTPEFMEVARALAREIFLLQAIRYERRKLLTTPPPPRDYHIFDSDPEFQEIKYEILYGDFIQEAPNKPWARWLISAAKYDDEVAAYEPTSDKAVGLILRRRREFQRLDEYERKALSRRKKLVCRLDYLTIEELRRERESGATTARH